MKTCTATESRPEEDPWIGEILDDRFAVTNLVDGGGRLYHAHDLQTLQRVVLQIIASPDGSPRYMVGLPPVPPDEQQKAATEASDVDEISIEISIDDVVMVEDPTERIEAAWFAQGDDLELDPLEAAAGDYRTLQENLDQLAGDLSDEALLRYSLQTVPTK